MKILCVHHKGGVGKTTTAIHITGVFLDLGNRVLLIDGDSQADSFKFFSEGAAPKPGGERLVTQDGMLTVVSERDNRNSNRFVSLGKLANDKSFHHTVIDIATDLPNISTILFELQPDMILIGVKRDDIGSFIHLNDMLLSLEQTRSVIGSKRVKVIPIGVQHSDFQEYVNDRFSGYEVLEPIDWVPMKAGKAVFIKYEY